MTAVLDAADLTVGYRRGRRTRPVLRGLHLEVAAGELVCALGPNGAGKSTLLRTLAGIQAPLDGSVRLAGEPVHRLPPAVRARRVAVVTTDQVEPGLLTAADLVALGRHPHTDWLGRLTAADRTAVAGALDAAGATGLACRRVSELSDGERQRVMIARALAQEPAAMLLDEPTAFVDLPRRVELTDLLHRLTRETQLAVLITTHDLERALRCADRLWLLDSSDAVVTGAPEDLILDGSLAAVLGGGRLDFDHASGTFRPPVASGPTARVSGPDPAARWTRNALERVGYVASTGGPVGRRPPADLEVEVVEHGTTRQWRAHRRDAPVVTATSIAQLISRVQAGVRTAPAGVSNVLVR